MGGARKPVAMKRVHPFTSLSRPPLAWGLGPARGCEQRASRARRLAAPGRRAPSLAARVLDDETTTKPPRRKARSRAVTCFHDTNNAPVGSQRVEGCCEHDQRVQQGEPRLDLSRTPLVTHRMRTASKHDVRRWSRVRPSPKRRRRDQPMGRRPSRSTERHRFVSVCSTASVACPAKGTNLATIEMPSVRPDEEMRGGSLPRHLVIGLRMRPRQAWDRGVEDQRLYDLVPR